MHSKVSCLVNELYFKWSFVGSSYSEKTSLDKNDSDHSIFSQMKGKEIILLGLKGHSFAFQLNVLRPQDNVCVCKINKP